MSSPIGYGVSGCGRDGPNGPTVNHKQIHSMLKLDFDVLGSSHIFVKFHVSNYVTRFE